MESPQMKDQFRETNIKAKRKKIQEALLNIVRDTQTEKSTHVLKTDRTSVQKSEKHTITINEKRMYMVQYTYSSEENAETVHVFKDNILLNDVSDVLHDLVYHIHKTILLDLKKELL